MLITFDKICLVLTYNAEMIFGRGGAYAIRPYGDGCQKTL